MSKHEESRQQNVETVAESVSRFFQYLLDLCICVYMLLIVVVMPFYSQEGYSHIGTDKSVFLRNCIVYGSRLVIPVLLFTLVMRLLVYVQENGWSDRSRISIKNMLEVLRKELSVTDLFAIAFGVSVVLSYMCSAYKEEALWGTVGWYMGLIPQLNAVAVYFLVSRAWKQRKWLIGLVLPVSAVVFLLGYLNRFGIYPIDMQPVTPHFISTIGNINWYCGYLVSIFFGGMFLFWQLGAKGTNVEREDRRRNWQKLLLTGYVILGFATLVTQGSNSGIVTMAVILLVFFGMSAQDGQRMEMFWMEMMLFSVACVITLVLRTKGVFVTTYPDFVIDLFTNSGLSIIMLFVSIAFLALVHISRKKGCYPEKIVVRLNRLTWVLLLIGFFIGILLITVNTVFEGLITKATHPSLDAVLTFSPKWGSNRGATWIAGWMCFWEQNILHKLIGVGPDCMAAFLYSAGSEQLVDMVENCFGDARLTNAHNEWLTILVNMGLLGLIGFVGMMVSAIKRFISHYKYHGNVITGACGICILAYTMNNMFSFQQSMNLATIFVLLGVGENCIRAQSNCLEGETD